MDRTWTLILPLLLHLPAPALGHKEPNLKHDTLLLSPQGVRVTVDYVVPAGDEARTLRRIFDQDHSGELSAGEQSALGALLLEQATHFLRVDVDGKEVTLQRERTDLQLGEGEGGRIAFTATVMAQIRLGDGEHALRITDRHKDRKETVPAVVKTDGVRLLSALMPQPSLFQGHPLEFRTLPTVP